MVPDVAGSLVIVPVVGRHCHPCAHDCCTPPQYVYSYKRLPICWLLTCVGRKLMFKSRIFFHLRAEYGENNQRGPAGVPTLC